MKVAPHPPDEAARLAELTSYEVLDTPPDPLLDDLTRIAAAICGTPIALVSLVDRDRQWFKSRVGLDATETPRDIAFCAHAIHDAATFVVEDTLDDERFRDNPLVAGNPHIRFYAGAPLETPSGRRIGTLCVIDKTPRALTESQTAALEALARQAVTQLEARKRLRELEEARAAYNAAEERLRVDTGPMRTSITRPIAPIRSSWRREAGLPAIVFAACLALTLWLARAARDAGDAVRAERFRSDIARVHLKIEERIDDYERLLRSGRAFFAASENVTPGEWSTFLQGIELDSKYPGVLGVGMIRPVLRRDVNTFLADARSTISYGYAIHPSGIRDDYFPILVIEPVSRNREAVGFDIGSEPNRRGAAERARDTGNTAVTPMITLVQDDERLPGFLLLLPVYRAGARVDSVEARRSALTGWIYLAARVGDLMKGVEGLQDAETAFRVWDGRPEEQKLLFEVGRPGRTPAGARPLKAVDSLQVAGRTWSVEVHPTNTFFARSENRTVTAILAGGTLASALLSIAFWSLLTTRRRALRMADSLAGEMTQTIQASQRYLRDLIDNVGEAIVVLDGEMCISTLNRLAEALLGLPPSKALGRPISSILQFAPSGVDETTEDVWFTRSDGTSRLLEIHARRMVLRGGDETSLVLRDVTEQRAADQERVVVREADIAVADATDFETAQVAIMDVLRRFVGWNYAEAWLVSDDRSRLLRGPSSIGDDPERKLSRFDARSRRLSLDLETSLPGRAWTSRAPVVIEDFSSDSGFARKPLARGAGLRCGIAIPVIAEGDEVVSVLVLLSEAAEPALARRAMLLGAIGCQVGNALQRRRFLDAIALSEERYRDLFESASDLIQSSDAQGRLLFVNRAWRETLEYDESEIAGLSVWDVIAPEYHEHCRTTIGSAEPSTGAVSLAVTFLSKSGRRVDVEGSASFRFEGERLLSTRAIFRDVTKVREINRLKRQFVATVSHELRTPLTSIQGGLDMLRGGVFGELAPAALELVDIAHRNCGRLLALINDLLDLERLDSGRLELHQEPVSVASLFAAASDSVRPFAARHGVTLEIDAPDAVVFADQARATQVLVNLLSNAVKFSPPGSSVWMNGSVDGDSAVITIRDRGRGIPAEFLDRIFERFEQVEASDTRSKGGTGLGLAISREIVVQHGGSISVSSAPGEGSTFTVRLPLAPA